MTFPDWPVWPEGVEGVIVKRMPLPLGEPSTCFVCGKQLPSGDASASCWGVPGRGAAHGGCYEPEDI